MFAKTALVCALFATSAQIAVAQAVVQPACFMKVFSSFQTETPGHYAADQKTLCCKEAAEFKSRIQSNLCPSGDQPAALSSYKTACEEAGYGSCSNSTSTSTSASAFAPASASGSALPSGRSNSSAPYPIVYTSTSIYFDTECSCTKTTAVVGVASATGLATGTGAGSPFSTGATSSGSSSGSGSGLGSASGSGVASGSPITPVSPSKTGSGPNFTGAATKNIGSVAAGLLAVAGVAMAL